MILIGPPLDGESQRADANRRAIAALGRNAALCAIDLHKLGEIDIEPKT